MHTTLLYILLQADPNTAVIAELVKQGPLITALGVAIWYFYQRQKTLEAAANAQADKYEALLKVQNEKMESYFRDDREKLIQVIENNTHVMEQLQDHINTIPK